MKLSEAIRTGAKKRPQAFGQLARKVNGVWGTCALGAAYEAVSGQLPRIKPTGELVDAVRKKLGGFKETTSDTITLPDGYTCSVGGALVILNDTLRWSREEIADYLEKQGY